MAAEEVHYRDINSVFTVTIKDDDVAVDISTATTKQLIFTKPSGSQLTKNASFYTDGTDGIIKYATVDGDLNEVGVWKLQAYIILSGGGTWHTDIAEFRVHRNL